MTTITIPINSELNDFIDEQVKLGSASSKADLVRRAIIKYKEDALLHEILIARQEIIDGKGVEGDLKDIIDRI